MAFKWDTNTLLFREYVEGNVCNTELYLWKCKELHIVQILVVVAIIQVKILKVEEEQGFMWTLNGHEWIGSNTLLNWYKYGKSLYFILYNSYIIFGDIFGITLCSILFLGVYFSY